MNTQTLYIPILISLSTIHTHFPLHTGHIPTNTTVDFYHIAIIYYQKLPP